MTMIRTTATGNVLIQSGDDTVELTRADLAVAARILTILTQMDESESVHVYWGSTRTIAAEKEQSGFRWID